MAIVYVVDCDQGVIEKDIGDIGNLAQMELELDAMHDEWYWDYADAMEAYTDYATNGGLY